MEMVANLKKTQTMQGSKVTWLIKFYGGLWNPHNHQTLATEGKFAAFIVRAESYKPPREPKL